MNEAVVITGGAKRIGKDIAIGMAQKGYEIILHYNHSKEEATRTCRLIEKTGQSCHLVRGDLGNTESLKQIMDTCFGYNQHISVLINNASVFKPGDFWDTDVKLLDNQFDINFKAPFLLTRYFAKHVTTGLVINILDRRIDQTPTDYFAYTLSKKALADFTRMAARALAPGIRVNGICPGPILPPEGKSRSYMQKMAGINPLKKTGSPEDILKAILFLNDNKFVTGDFIYIDGGEHLL